MKLGIVIPLYNERDLLPELIERIDAAADALAAWSVQVILVDDGSRDGSRAWLANLEARGDRYRVLLLSRNFGHQAAITAGINEAQGDAVVIMDGDLQDPPELISQLVERWEAGADVVRAVRRSRAESGPRAWGFTLFHRLLHRVTDLPDEGDTGVFALLDREALQALRSLPERHRFLPGLRSWIGFRQERVEFDRPDRATGKPRQSLWRLASYALDAFFSFSYKPLRFMTLAGLVISTLGFALASVFVVRRLLKYEIADIGFTTLVTLILFLGGVQLICFGVLGEYVARIYDEVKARPLYVVQRRSPRGACSGSGQEDLGDA